MSSRRFLSGSWDFGTERERLIHRIHSYPAKFPGFITTKALEYAEKKGVKVGTVADIFCGCGTTAVEAKRNGKDFWGCDINPVATMIAQVKTKEYKDNVLEDHYLSIKRKFNSIRVGEKKVDRVNDRIKYWYEKENIRDLLRLKKAILLETSKYSPYQKFFLCAFSNILKSTSRWLTKSIKPQIDPDKRPKNVMEAFEGQFALMRKANRENVFKDSSNSRVKIMCKDLLGMRSKQRSADLIVTSPPYVTSYDYADIHQLSVLWFGYYGDYRDLRKNMMGNTYGAQSLPDHIIESLPRVGQTIYKKLLEKHKVKAHSTARYFVDIQRAVLKCYGSLNKGGMAVFVIGNTSYKGVHVDNKKFLEICMEEQGFQDIEVISRKISLKNLTPYRDASGRFTRNSKKREVYKSESVVIGRKR